MIVHSKINIIAVLSDESLAFSIGVSTFIVLANVPLLKVAVTMSSHKYGYFVDTANTLPKFVSELKYLQNNGENVTVLQLPNDSRPVCSGVGQTDEAGK